MQTWANRSRHSLKKSDRERIVLVDLLKIATVSESLSIYFRKSDISDSLMIRENHSKKTCFWYVFDCFPPFYAKRANRSCRSLQKSDRERIDPVDVLKRATGAIRSGGSLKKIDGRIHIFPERSQKTSDSLEKPMIEFPTLIIRYKVRI